MAWRREKDRQVLGALYLEEKPRSSGGRRMEWSNSKVIENIRSTSFSEFCLISSLNQLKMLSVLYLELVKAGIQNHQSWKFPKLNFLLGPKRLFLTGSFWVVIETLYFSFKCYAVTHHIILFALKLLNCLAFIWPYVNLTFSFIM